MKSTDQKLFPCEQFNAERASAQIQHEVSYTQQVSEAKQSIEDKKQSKVDDDVFFYKALYIFIHVAAVLLVLLTVYHFWGK